MAPMLAGLLEHYPGIRHIKVEDGPGRLLGRSFRVKVWPNLVFLRDGQVIRQLARPDEEEAKEGLRADRSSRNDYRRNQESETDRYTVRSTPPRNLSQAQECQRVLRDVDPWYVILASFARNVHRIVRHGLLPRPGNGPLRHSQTGQRVFAVAIVLSLLTWPARKTTIPSAAKAAASHPRTGSRGSGATFAPSGSSTGRGRARNA